MPLNDFIGKRQSQKLDPDDMQRRQKIAAGMRVETSPRLRASLQTKNVLPFQSEPSKPQRSPDYPLPAPSLFGDSTLGEDSDDTTRGLDGNYGHQNRPMGYSRIQQTFSQGNPSHGIGGRFDDEAMDFVEDEGGRGLNNGNDVLEETIDGENNYAHGSGNDSDDSLNPAAEPRQTRATRESQIAAEQFLKIQRYPEVTSAIKNQRSGRFSQAPFNPAIRQSGRGTTTNSSHEYLNSGLRPDEPTSSHIRNPVGGDETQSADQDPHGEFEDDQQRRLAQQYGPDDMQVGKDFLDASQIVGSGSGESGHGHHGPRANRWSQQNNNTSKRKPDLPELDYESSALSKMKYSDLKDQPFDTNPKAPPSIIPNDLQGLDIPLQDRLRHFASAEPDAQAEFFAQMPMDQWEQSGDWFVQQFSDLMTKMQEARRAKREVSRTFEAELARREEAVRGRSEGIVGVLQQMRTEGQSVLSGRTS